MLLVSLGSTTYQIMEEDILNYSPIKSHLSKDTLYIYIILLEKMSFVFFISLMKSLWDFVIKPQLNLCCSVQQFHG